MEQLLARAKTLIELGRAREALTLLFSSGSEYSEDVTFLGQVAYAFLTLEDFQQAEAYARKAIGANPTEEWAYRILASALHSQNDTDRAINVLFKARKLFPESPHLLYLLSIFHTVKRYLYTAGELNKQLLTLAPHSSLTYEALSFLALGNRDWQSAEAHAREALQINPASSEALRFLGLSLQRRNKLQKAITSFWWSVRLDPTSPLSQEALSIALSKYSWYIPIAFIAGCLLAITQGMYVPLAILVVILSTTIGVLLRKDRLLALPVELQEAVQNNRTLAFYFPSFRLIWKKILSVLREPVVGCAQGCLFMLLYSLLITFAITSESLFRKILFIILVLLIISLVARRILWSSRQRNSARILDGRFRIGD